METMKAQRLFGLVFLTTRICGNAAEFSHDPTKWEEITPPTRTNEADFAVWEYAANYSRYEWRVLRRSGTPFVALKDDATEFNTNAPNFVPRAGKFVGASASFAVRDGWLIGFNEGEFGAALYWFSRDGSNCYKISDHQVVIFFQLSSEIYALEGLNHLGISRGSIILLANTGARWRATEFAKLPVAPYTVAVRRDGSALITLSDSLVSLDSQFRIRTLLTNAPWSGLYPNSSVLSQDDRKLYIGMRQFVAEFNIETGTIRLLVPSYEFINKLSTKDERQIRKPYEH